MFADQGLLLGCLLIALILAITGTLALVSFSRKKFPGPVISGSGMLVGFGGCVVVFWLIVQQMGGDDPRLFIGSFIASTVFGCVGTILSGYRKYLKVLGCAVACIVLLWVTFQLAVF